MVRVSEGFKLENGELTLYKGRDPNRFWPSLPQVLQGDSATRATISYYRVIALEWMADPSVDVLAQCAPGVPCLPVRDDVREDGVRQYGKLCGYLGANGVMPRKEWPTPPPRLRVGHWKDGSQSRREADVAEEDRGTEP